jgi:hypothetical protein
VRPVRAAARLAAPPWGGLAAGAAVAAALAIAAGAGHGDARVSPSTGAARAARAPATAAGVTAATPERPRRRVALIGGKALQSARCRQWQGGTAPERDAVVAALAAVVGGPTPYGPASTLPAAEAHRLFDRACARRYARGFLLYELYTRAAAFHATPQRLL